MYKWLSSQLLLSCSSVVAVGTLVHDATLPYLLFSTWVMARNEGAASRGRDQRALPEVTADLSVTAYSTGARNSYKNRRLVILNPVSVTAAIISLCSVVCCGTDCRAMIIQRRSVNTVGYPKR